MKTIIYMFRTKRRTKNPVKHLRCEAFCEYSYPQKVVNYFCRKLRLRSFRLGFSEHASGISKVKCNLKVKFTF